MDYLWDEENIYVFQKNEAVFVVDCQKSADLLWQLLQVSKVYIKQVRLPLVIHFPIITHADTISVKILF